MEGVQPGIYQILSSGLTQTADGHIFVTAGDGVSILQSAPPDGLSGENFCFLDVILDYCITTVNVLKF